MPSLKNLITALGTSINQAQAQIDLSVLDLYSKLFDSSHESNPTPKTINLPVPSEDNNYELRKIPIPALLNYSSLSLDEVNLKICLSPAWNEESNEIDANFSARIPEGENVNRKSQRVTPCELNLNFKRHDHPEGIIKHVRELLKTL